MEPWPRVRLTALARRRAPAGGSTRVATPPGSAAAGRGRDPEPAHRPAAADPGGVATRVDPPAGARRRASAVRRTRGQGSIYFQRSRGLYAAAVDQGSLNGKRHRKIVFGQTIREVSEKLPHLQVAQ